MSSKSRLLLPVVFTVLLAVASAQNVFAGCITIAGFVINKPDPYSADNFYRRAAPIIVSALGISQVVTDGSVILHAGLGPGSGHVSSGFYFILGPLSSISSATPLSIKIMDQVQTGGMSDTSTSGLALNLWFDANENGEFFGWDTSSDPQVIIYPSGDKYGFGPHVVGGFLTVTDSTSFSGGNIGGPHTVAELKSGSAEAGINVNTLTAVWIGIDGTDGMGTARIVFSESSVQLCPTPGPRPYQGGVGGIVVPTNTLAVLAPYLAVIGLVATVAIAVKKRKA